MQGNLNNHHNADDTESILSLQPDKDRILLFEHDPVYTLGRGADEENLTFLDREPDGGKHAREKLSRKARGKESARLDSGSFYRQSSSNLQNTLENMLQEVDLFDSSSPVLAPNGAPIYRIERGGEVTYHGPGQLVAYPLLNLQTRPYKKDLHWYLRCVEEVIIQTLSYYDITGVRDDINSGVWVGDKKIAAVGVSSSRWITTHGFALNIDPNLSHFDTSIIIPCGIEGRGVTSIAEILKERQSGECDALPMIQNISDVILSSFCQVFNVTTVDGTKIT